MDPRSKKEMARIEKALAATGAAPSLAIALPVKLRMARLILNLKQNRRNFGLFVILGWRNRWKSYADTPDASQDIFARRKVNIVKIPPREDRRDSITETINFDGAILIDRHGTVLHSGAMIEGLRPRAVARALGQRRAGDLSAQFGFRRKVHMRHIAAIVSSYLFAGTTVFTVSEETNDMHIFEGGRIVYSTVRGESHRPA